MLDTRMTAEYEGLYSAILESLVQEKILHVDETSVKLRGVKGLCLGAG